MLQSRTPFVDALIRVITEYWTEQDVWATPRETAVIRYVRKRLGSLHGVDKVRNALKDLATSGVLHRLQQGRYEVMYRLRAHRMWASHDGYLDPWREVLVDPSLYVSGDGSCWVFGKPALRGAPKLYRLPVYPRHVQEFVIWRARYHLRWAGFEPDHPEIEILVPRACGDALLGTARFFFNRCNPKSSARFDLETDGRYIPIVIENRDPLEWKRRQRGKKKNKRWRPEDDSWSYRDELEDVLMRFYGGWQPPTQRGPFRAADVFQELDARLKGAIDNLLQLSPPSGAELKEPEHVIPDWVVRATAPRIGRRRPQGTRTPPHLPPSTAPKAGPV